MQKVKVQRYISGKRPDYAPAASSEDDSDNDDFLEQQRPEKRHQMLPHVIKDMHSKMDVDSDTEVKTELLLTYIEIRFQKCIYQANDPRLRRLKAARNVPEEEQDDSEGDGYRRRHTVEPEVLAVAEPEDDDEPQIEQTERGSSAESDEELNEEEIELKR